MKYWLINQNQTDARYEIADGGVCQTLTARCGTGGGHVPMVLMFDGERRHDYEQINGAAPTVTAKYGTGGGNTPLVMYASTGYGEYHEGLPCLKASGGDVGGVEKD